MCELKRSRRGIWMSAEWGRIGYREGKEIQWTGRVIFCESMSVVRMDVRAGGKSNRVDLVIISGVKRGRARWERLDLGDMWRLIATCSKLIAV